MAFGIPPWIVGIILVIICGSIFMGGVGQPTSVTGKLVPIMVAFFLIGGLRVPMMWFQYIPDTFDPIFKYAFRPQAIIGGRLGMAAKTAANWGAKGGLFLNGAGMGSTPYAHALAIVKNLHEQGCVAMIGARYLFVPFRTVHNFWLELIREN